MPELNKQLLSGGIFPLQQGGVCRSLLLSDSLCLLVFISMNACCARSGNCSEMSVMFFSPKSEQGGKC